MTEEKRVVLVWVSRRNPSSPRLYTYTPGHAVPTPLHSSPTHRHPTVCTFTLDEVRERFISHTPIPGPDDPGPVHLVPDASSLTNLVSRSAFRPGHVYAIPTDLAISHLGWNPDPIDP